MVITLGPFQLPALLAETLEIRISRFYRVATVLTMNQLPFSATSACHRPQHNMGSVLTSQSF
jgi:hypothetical protein